MALISILHFSDTHGLHGQLDKLPAADVIVHSGDFTMAGTEREAMDFINWFCDLPYRHKIFVAGNHDDCLWGADISGLGGNCHYLCNSGVCLEGVKFYGMPMFMGDVLSGKDVRNIAAIPSDTDVLITHRPPAGVLDFDSGIHYGAYELLNKVRSIRPRLHLFGHIHAAYGVDELEGIVFSNAALVDEGHRLERTRVDALTPFYIDK